MDLFSQLRYQLNDALANLEADEDNATVKENIEAALEILDEIAPSISDPLDFSRHYVSYEEDEEPPMLRELSF